MKFISWNVNGIRACIGKGFEESFRLLDADIFCLQETKCQQGQVKLDLPGYYQYWNYANRRGYSGTAIFTKKEPLSVAYGLGIEEHDKEGRVITLEFEDFYFIEVQIILLRLSLPLLLFLPPTVCLLQEPILLHNVRTCCRDVPMFPGTGGLWNVRRIP